MMKDDCSMDKERYVFGKDYKRLKLRKKRYKDGVLLTNDYGKWIFLTQEENEELSYGRLTGELFRKLEENLMILTDDNMEDIPRQINNYYWYLNKGTSLHILVPTLRCNLTCRYCYAFRSPLDAKDKDMTPEILDKTIDFVFKSPSDIYTIEFTGGEPLLRFDLVRRAVERAEKFAETNDKHVKFSIVTNGLYLTEEMIQFFEDHKVGICLSLDGPQELHDRHRRITKNNTGSYSMVVEKLRHLKERKFHNVNAIPVITKDSLSQWKEIVDEYVSLNLRNLRFKYIGRFGFASNIWEKMSYSADEFLESWRNVMEYLIELNKKGIA
ncbi:MAG: radical SAM protein, partial [Candidatus Woesearchaeota archaeon]